MRLLPAVLLAAASISYAQQPADIPAQREAMKKLAFLVGKWAGEVFVFQGRDPPKKVLQTEEVQYKLNDLLLVVEGTGRSPSTGEVVFNAFATIAYDVETASYRFRAYNDGRYLDTQLKVSERGFEWGVKADRASVRYVMRLNEKGEWVEIGEVTIGDNPPRKIIDMTVRRQK